MKIMVISKENDLLFMYYKNHENKWIKLEGDDVKAMRILSRSTAVVIKSENAVVRNSKILPKVRGGKIVSLTEPTVYFIPSKASQYCLEEFGSFPSVATSNISKLVRYYQQLPVSMCEQLAFINITAGNSSRLVAGRNVAVFGLTDETLHEYLKKPDTGKLIEPIIDQLMKIDRNFKVEHTGERHWKFNEECFDFAK